MSPDFAGMVGGGIVPKGIAITISGQLGDDAKHYPEREVAKKIEESQK